MRSCVCVCARACVLSRAQTRKRTCPRVVRADRSLGGYFGGSAPGDPRMQAKVRLLEAEGVSLERSSAGTRVAASSLWRFPCAPDLAAVRLPDEARAPQHDISCILE